MQLINSSLYNALNAGNIAQFQSENIVTLLRNNMNNLTNYGFQSDFIQEFQH